MKTFLKIVGRILSVAIDIWCIIAFILIVIPLPDRVPQITDSTITIIAIYCAFLWLCSRVNWWGYKRGWKHGQVSGWQAHVDHVKVLLRGIEMVGGEMNKMHTPAYNKLRGEITDGMVPCDDCNKDPGLDLDTDYKPNL